MKVKIIVAMFFILCFLSLFIGCGSEPTHTHSFGDWMVKKEATCTENGEMARSCECGEIVVREEPIAKLEHSYVGGKCKHCSTPFVFQMEGEFILFGSYPQTLKAENVIISDQMDERGYYLGSDGEWYARVIATPNESDYTFSTGETIEANREYYFKVEPIKWRVNLKSNGEATLDCQSILTNRRYDSHWSDYDTSEIRTWLKTDFYETAFNELQKELILVTRVGTKKFGDDYCYTDDKVYLPNLVSSARGYPNDYARATGLWLANTPERGTSSRWWIREPNRYYESFVTYADENGKKDKGGHVSAQQYGIVPSVRIQLQDK